MRACFIFQKLRLPVTEKDTQQQPLATTSHAHGTHACAPPQRMCTHKPTSKNVSKVVLPRRPLCPNEGLHFAILSGFGNQKLIVVTVLFHVTGRTSGGLKGIPPLWVLWAEKPQRNTQPRRPAAQSRNKACSAGAKPPPTTTDLSNIVQEHLLSGFPWLLYTSEPRAAGLETEMHVEGHCLVLRYKNLSGI